MATAAWRPAILASGARVKSRVAESGFAQITSRRSHAIPGSPFAGRKLEARPLRDEGLKPAIRVCPHAATREAHIRGCKERPAAMPRPARRRPPRRSSSGIRRGRLRAIPSRVAPMRGGRRARPRRWHAGSQSRPVLQPRRRSRLLRSRAGWTDQRDRSVLVAQDRCRVPQAARSPWPLSRRRTAARTHSASAGEPSASMRSHTGRPTGGQGLSGTSRHAAGFAALTTPSADRRKSPTGDCSNDRPRDRRQCRAHAPPRPNRGTRSLWAASDLGVSGLSA